MDSSAYHQFVKETSQFETESYEEKKAIAIYGIAGEIGSVVSSVKKQLLQESGSADWNSVNDEIIEDIGDAIWYCFSLVRSNRSFQTVIDRHQITAANSGAPIGTPNDGRLLG